MKGQSRILNPPFDPRILNIGSPSQNAKGLKRGKLVLDSGTRIGSLKGMGIRFLYNPVAVSVSHNLGDVSGVGQQPNAGSATQAGTYANLGGVSISLLYDRTYELWDGSKKSTLAGTYGVYADVLAYYRLTGLVESSVKKVKAGVSPVSITETSFNIYPTKPIDPTRRYFLYVGDKLRWYGMLSDFEVEYSHFTKNMIPSRAAVTISVQFQNDLHGPKKTISKGIKQGKKHEKTPPPVTP